MRFLLSDRCLDTRQKSPEQKEKGLFSEARINRDLNILSKGKILTLNETQKKFIQTVAQPENIEKKIVHIEGKVGSGKTLLGIEIVKMKLNHYFRKYNLSVNDLENKLKVSITKLVFLLQNKQH